MAGVKQLEPKIEIKPAWKCPRFVNRHRRENGKVVYYFRRKHGPRIRLPDDMHSQEFREAYAAAMASKPVYYRKTARPRNERILILAKRFAAKAAEKAKYRAQKSNQPCDITPKWIFEQLEKQNYKCLVTKKRFWSGGEFRSRDPYAPSIDRISPGGGYTKDNTRIVLLGLNVMILDWGFDVAKDIIDAVPEKYLTK